VGALPAPLLGRRDGQTVPDVRYRLAGQTLEVDHLAAYERVCGFPVTDSVPPTYLHVLAFPVTVEVMTRPDFPFSLLGLIHLRNVITVLRPVTAGETVDFEVGAESLRDHAAGRVVDLAVTAAVDGQPVWTGRSTYLRRAGPGGRRAPSRHADVETSEQRVPALVRAPEDIGRRYAAVSGDRNPIHLFGAAAKAFGFRTAIAHGMWLKARTLAMLHPRLPAAPYTVDVTFKTPVFLPSTVAVFTRRLPAGWDLDVRAAGDGRPHLSGTVRAL
jgi:acyl dehydratase